MLSEIGINAKEASKHLGNLNLEIKNKILNDMAYEIELNSQKILLANEQDLQEAKNFNLTDALSDRLRLDEIRINGMCNGLKKIIALNDPVGEITKSWTTSEGLKINKVRSPFGVIGIIYEARPNVTSDVTGLCIKSGNAAVLRGSSYALNSNLAILECLQSALIKNNIDKNSVQLIQSKDREDTIKFMQMTEYIDLIIPRGGKGLIQTLVENAKVPFILDGDGNVHLYVHEDADESTCTQIILNSKVQRPGVCNALETLIIHENIYKKIGKEIINSLLENEVELFVDPKIKLDFPNLQEADKIHYETEFHDLKLAIKIVNSSDEAILHIQKYSTGHTESILTSSDAEAEKFSKLIDSSVVFINASTRFTDGEMFGFGAEIGISTQKLHVRGPMGLEALTNERYIVKGEGKVRN